MKIEVIYAEPTGTIQSEILNDVDQVIEENGHLVLIRELENGPRETIAAYRGGDHLAFGWLRWKEVA